MRRRQFLASGALGTVTLTGCLGEESDDGDDGTDAGSPTDPSTTTDRPATDESAETDAPTTVRDRPDGIYVQPFEEQMSMQGTDEAGDYAFALMFAVPHDFWNVTGNSLSATTVQNDDSLHLMASVWDPETRTVLPETGLSVEITQDGSLVSEEVIYPMLSQPMSFHYGANFSLPGYGTYAVTVSVGGTNIRRTGAFEGRFGDAASVEIPLEFTEETQEEVASRPLDRAGDRGALGPMDMMTPSAVLPPESEMPGAVRGSAMTDDARFVVTTLEDGPLDADGAYLVASARTRYNQYVLPGMTVEATLERDGSTVYDGPLRRTFDSDLGYHYGAAVDGVEAGDELTLSVPTIPQVARHEGYETAFREMDDVSVTL